MTDMEPYVGQIMAVAFPMAPKNWALCNGQLLGIAQNQALFSLISTYFGGNGTTNFALPDLRGRTVRGMSNQPGMVGGAENVTLITSQMASHSHSFSANTTVAATGRGAARANGNSFGATGGTTTIYDAPDVLTALSGNVLPAGNSQPHNNMQPYTTLNFIISLTGIYPSRP